jgi:hypothetical protein
MMINKFVNGQVRKIESESKLFFDFEFWAEADEDTYGFVCLVQRSDPLNIFITVMNPNELVIPSITDGMEAVKDRVTKDVGIKDLVFPRVIRFEEKENDVMGGFKDFLKAYKSPVAIYESIFDQEKEAMQVEKITIDMFRILGGRVHLLDGLQLEPATQ